MSFRSAMGEMWKSDDQKVYPLYASPCARAVVATKEVLPRRTRLDCRRDSCLGGWRGGGPGAHVRVSSSQRSSATRRSARRRWPWPPVWQIPAAEAATASRDAVRAHLLFYRLIGPELARGVHYRRSLGRLRFQLHLLDVEYGELGHATAQLLRGPFMLAHERREGGHRHHDQEHRRREGRKQPPAPLGAGPTHRKRLGQRWRINGCSGARGDSGVEEGIGGGGGRRRVGELDAVVLVVGEVPAEARLVAVESED